MLHLHACYVSKAAIFIDAGTSPAGRKSKSRLNSKGLGRYSAAFGDGFSLASLTA